jgi:beta-lactamase class A
MKKKRIIIFLSAALICFSVFAFQYKKSFEASREKQRVILEKRRAAWLGLKSLLEKEVSDFKGQSAVIIKDLNTGWQYSYNKEVLFPSASLVKIPIMAACFYAANEGRISFRDKLRLEMSSKVPGSGELKNLPAGTEFSVEKLTELMITKSDNTATNMLTDFLGMDYLNNFFKSEGLLNTNLSRRMMDFRKRKKGVENYTTAADIACILEKIYQGRFINKQTSAKCLSLLLHQKVNDRIPKKLPEDAIVAHKTGLERHVCHDAGIVFTPQGHVLICVLTKSKDRAKKAKEFISDVALYIYSNYQTLNHNS